MLGRIKKYAKIYVKRSEFLKKISFLSFLKNLYDDTTILKIKTYIIPSIWRQPRVEIGAHNHSPSSAVLLLELLLHKFAYFSIVLEKLKRFMQPRNGVFGHRRGHLVGSIRGGGNGCKNGFFGSGRHLKRVVECQRCRWANLNFWENQKKIQILIKKLV